jgi:hypothetical protein
MGCASVSTCGMQGVGAIRDNPSLTRAVVASRQAASVPLCAYRAPAVEHKVCLAQKHCIVIRAKLPEHYTPERLFLNEHSLLPNLFYTLITNKHFVVRTIKP